MKNSPIKDSGAREARNYAVNAKVAADDGNKKAEKYDKKEALISAADSSPSKMINLNNGHKPFMSNNDSPAKRHVPDAAKSTNKTKITGAMGSDLRIQQYKANNWAMDDTTRQKAKPVSEVSKIKPKGIKGEVKSAAASVGNKVSQSKGAGTPNKPVGTSEKIVVQSKPKSGKVNIAASKKASKAKRVENRTARKEKRVVNRTDRKAKRANR